LTNESIRERNDKKIATVVRYFNIIMAIFYLTAAAVILALPEVFTIDSTTRYGVSAIFAVYGLYRFYRIINKDR
jgi:hypothetical protein